MTVSDEETKQSGPLVSDNEATQNQQPTAEERVREGFFSPKPCVQTQLYNLLTHRGTFMGELEALVAKGAAQDLSQATKSRILAALQMAGETQAAGCFLQHCDVIEVLKACQVLDRPRHVRQIQGRIDDITAAHPHSNGNNDSKPKKRSRKLDQYQAQLKEMNAKTNESHTADMPCHDAHEHPAVQEIVASASLSGSFAKKVRAWAQQLPCDLLEFNVLSESMECWKELADLVHFKPSDFRLPYFLSVVHKGTLDAAPEGSLVHGLLSLTQAPDEGLVKSFVSLAEKHPQVYKSYTYLRTQHARLLEEKQVCKMLATHIPLGTLVWYLDDMEDTANTGGALAQIAADRLKNESGWVDEVSKVTESFGKLLERILAFRSRGWTETADQLMPAAQRKLNSLRETWAGAGEGEEDGLTVVIGDKSGSMEHAIRSASIIATMISTCFDGQLYFVDSEIWPSPHLKPCTVEQVLEICHKVKAEGHTCLSAALWPFYRNKKKIQRLVVVSDENDLVKHQGFNFAQLVSKYREDVNEEMELIVVSVGEGCWSMLRDLSTESVQHERIAIDAKRPDLTKFDSMISRIALLSKSSTEGSLERVKRVWGEIEGLSNQLYLLIAQENPSVANPYVNEHYPGDLLFGQINGQFLALETNDGKLFSMNRALLRQVLEDRAFFKANLAVVLAFLERWQGEECC